MFIQRKEQFILPGQQHDAGHHKNSRNEYGEIAQAAEAPACNPPCEKCDGKDQKLNGAEKGIEFRDSKAVNSFIKKIKNYGKNQKRRQKPEPETIENGSGQHANSYISCLLQCLIIQDRIELIGVPQQEITQQ